METIHAATVADGHELRATVGEELNALQRLGARRECMGIVEQERKVVEAAIPRGAPQHHHTILIPDRQRPQQKRFGHREHGRRQADP